MSNIVDSLIEIKLGEEEDFLKVKETLTRIGVASRKDKTLIQSAHILHKQGKFYIVSFKSMFELDGRPSTITEDDKQRIAAIVKLLEEWGLVKVTDHCRHMIRETAPISTIKVLKHSEKSEWNLVSKYTIGRKN